MTPLRVVIVDDHPIFRDGLRSLLESTDGIEVVGEASTGREAIAVVRRLRPDVVVMDLGLPDVDGPAATEVILDELPGTAVLALTMFADDASVFAAVAAGARGYVLKGAGQAEIVRSIRAAARGEATFAADVAGRVSQFVGGRTSGRPVAFPELTPREREVLDLVAHGWSNERIAGELFLSHKTVRNHVSNVFAKIGADSRGEAIVRAREKGLGRIRFEID